MIRYHALLVALLFCITMESRGDSCPSPEMIIKRDLSKRYEWTVDENTSLRDLLSVKEFKEARVMEHGSFVACFYTSEKGTVRLDAAPVKSECSLTLHDDKWTSVDDAQDVCADKSTGNCAFTYTCDTEKKDRD